MSVYIGTDGNCGTRVETLKVLYLKRSSNGSAHLVLLDIALGLNFYSTTISRTFKSATNSGTFESATVHYFFLLKIA